MTAAVPGRAPVTVREGKGMKGSLCVSRLMLGTAYLTWSALAARHRQGPAAVRAVAGILGARHLAQALLTAGQPARTVIALGAEVDTAHAASMIMLGSLSGRWRAAAFADALLAGSFAAAGVACATTMTGGESAASSVGTFQGWRDRRADSLARYLAPAWLSGTSSWLSGTRLPSGATPGRRSGPPPGRERPCSG